MLTTMTTELSPGYEVTEEIEIVTYEDCIAIMDKAIEDSLTLRSLDRRSDLHGKALRAFKDAKTVREAITSYLSSLDPHSKEWDEWIDEYTEGELIAKFNVDI